MSAAAWRRKVMGNEMGQEFFHFMSIFFMIIMGLCPVVTIGCKDTARGKYEHDGNDGTVSKCVSVYGHDFSYRHIFTYFLFRRPDSLAFDKKSKGYFQGCP
jgi:hypothetical protein